MFYGVSLDEGIGAVAPKALLNKGDFAGISLDLLNKQV